MQLIPSLKYFLIGVIVFLAFQFFGYLDEEDEYSVMSGWQEIELVNADGTVDEPNESLTCTREGVLTLDPADAMGAFDKRLVEIYKAKGPEVSIAYRASVSYGDIIAGGIFVYGELKDGGALLLNNFSVVDDDGSLIEALHGIAYISPEELWSMQQVGSYLLPGEVTALNYDPQEFLIVLPDGSIQAQGEYFRL